MKQVDLSLYPKWPHDRPKRYEEMTYEDQCVIQMIETALLCVDKHPDGVPVPYRYARGRDLIADVQFVPHAGGIEVRTTQAGTTEGMRDFLRNALGLLPQDIEGDPRSLLVTYDDLAREQPRKAMLAILSKALGLSLERMDYAKRMDSSSESARSR